MKGDFLCCPEIDSKASLSLPLPVKMASFGFLTKKEVTFSSGLTTEPLIESQKTTLTLVPSFEKSFYWQRQDEN